MSIPFLTATSLSGTMALVNEIGEKAYFALSAEDRAKVEDLATEIMVAGRTADQSDSGVLLTALSLAYSLVLKDAAQKAEVAR